MPFPKPVIADEDICSEIGTLWSFQKKFVILAGPPGTGKTRAAEDWVSTQCIALEPPLDPKTARLTNLFPDYKVRTYSTEEIRSRLEEDGVRFTWDIAVLHPQYAYEDLVRGLQLDSSQDGTLPSLTVREGILSFAARVAQVLEDLSPESERPLATLILDEINRAPIGQLFGEALYALDRRGEPVTTPYLLEDVGVTIVIPKSLQILGTMNSIDRATAGFDLALRRRFASIEFRASRSAVESRWNDPHQEFKLGVELFDKLTSFVERAEQVGEIPLPELVLGQAYFLPPQETNDPVEMEYWLATSYVYQMVPTLNEYEAQGFLKFRSSDIESLPSGLRLDQAKLAARLASSESSARELLGG